MDFNNSIVSCNKKQIDPFICKIINFYFTLYDNLLPEPSFMKKLLLFFLLSYSLTLTAQYHGGFQDGYALVFSSQENVTPNIFNGGGNDGFSFLLSTTQNQSAGIYTGGSNDGFHSIIVTQQNTIPGIYTGGINDGFSVIKVPFQNSIPGIYTGGAGDGFALTVQNLQNATPNIFTGGVNDGYNMILSPLQNQTLNIFTGGANDGWSTASHSTYAIVYEFIGVGNWDIPSNWKNNVIPPSPLPANYEIIINPSGINCILNVPQILSPGSKLTIINGKTFVIPGDIQ